MWPTSSSPNTAMGPPAKSISSSRNRSCVFSISVSDARIRVSGTSGEIALPAELLMEVWPHVHDLQELKLAMAIAVLASLDGTASVSLDRLQSFELTRQALAAESPEPFEIRLARTLARAVANGIILRLAIRIGGRRQELYLSATNDNRRHLAELRAGDESVLEAVGIPIEADVTLYRANVFALYEQHIGPLTPLLADQLRDAERLYPRRWLEEAIALAADGNR